MILENKIALVTGGSRGIGKAISLALASEGAFVYLTYNSEKTKGEEVVNEIVEKGGKAVSVQLDVKDSSSISDVINLIKDGPERLDILVNNAGINKPTDFDSITEEDWDNIMAVNLKGPFMCTQAALLLLRNAETASVINIGSVSGQYGGPRTAHYAASKAGLISLGQVIARLGAADGIRCNTIAAGLIESEMAEVGMKSGVVANAAKSIILNRFGTQKEVADVVVFLASDRSSYITAQTINVNGGLYF